MKKRAIELRKQLIELGGPAAADGCILKGNYRDTVWAETGIRLFLTAEFKLESVLPIKATFNQLLTIHSKIALCT